MAYNLDANHHDLNTAAKQTGAGDLSPKQRENISDCRAAGLPVEVARTTADVERIYYKYLETMKNGHNTARW